jgi:prepilin peptidase CpaA
MQLFAADNWPLWFIGLGMILSAIIDGWKRKVPNWLTYPLILSGWLLGLLHNFGMEQGGKGGLGTSLICTLVAFFLMFWIYAIGGMGAGDGKMVMGFGAWLGAFFYPPGEAVKALVVSWAAGVLVGGVIALGIIIYRGSYKENVANVRAILLSFVSGGGLTQISQKGDEIRARGPKLPYGIPLCIGFVGYLLYLYSGTGP